jgi:hypothetical protein
MALLEHRGGRDKGPGKKLPPVNPEDPEVEVAANAVEFLLLQVPPEKRMAVLERATELEREERGRPLLVKIFSPEEQARFWASPYARYRGRIMKFRALVVGSFTRSITNNPVRRGSCFSTAVTASSKSWYSSTVSPSAFSRQTMPKSQGSSGSSGTI